MNELLEKAQKKAQEVETAAHDKNLVAQRAVAGIAFDVVAADQRVEVVPRMLREQFARQPDRAQHLRPGPVDTAALRGGAQESDVEAGVVGDQHRLAGELEEHRQALVGRDTVDTIPPATMDGQSESDGSPASGAGALSTR